MFVGNSSQLGFGATTQSFLQQMVIGGSASLMQKIPFDKMPVSPLIYDMTDPRQVNGFVLIIPAQTH